jgi:hypothetical protein
MGVRRLHLYLYEAPVPVVLLPAAWAALSRHRHPSDAVVVAGLAAPPLLYMFYWHSGFFLGPRFYYGAVPWLAIALARSAQWLWRLARRPAWRRWNAPWLVGTAGATVVLWSVFGLVPDRFASYRDSFPTFKRHPETALTRAGVTRALVLVPESWGSRTVADLWALGGQPGLVERAYRRADLCELAEFVQRARDGNLTGRALDDSLQRFASAPAAPLVRDWPDPTLRLRPNASVPERCRSELARDQNGFTVYGNLAWLNAVGLDRGVIFARDFFERDSELLRHYPDWPVFRYAPPPGRPDALPVLSRVVETQ